jgi:hypothetical protein
VKGRERGGGWHLARATELGAAAAAAAAATHSVVLGALDDLNVGFR